MITLRHVYRGPPLCGKPRASSALPALCIVLITITLLSAGVTASPLPLTTTQSGTVSGDLYVGAFQNPAWNSQSSTPGVKEFTQSFSIPTFTNVQWARLETVVYAAGTDNRHGQTTIRFDGNGDGTYETTLGVEDQQTAASGDAEVYPVSNHMDRCYSDYRIWYDVTSLITTQNPAAYVKTENLDSSAFDGRLKEITLVVAYNDGDSDQVMYWVNTGHDYQASGASGVTTSFDTTSVPAGFTAATLKNVGIASKDALYTFNTMTPTGADPIAPYNYFETHSWDVMSGITAGSASTFGYTNNAGSFKTTIAALTIRGSPPAQPDLVVTAISPNVGAGAFLFANEPNVISVTVKNNGSGAATASTLGVDVAGAAYTASVGTVASGASQTVTISDTISRAGSESVTITATADSTSAVTESDEGNNVLTSAQTVYNNGYKGKRFTGGSDMNMQAGPFDGNYGVVYSAGDSAYNSAGWTEKTYSWTSAQLPIPAGATISSARLYQGYTWDQTPGGSPLWTMTFNGAPVTPVATYTDRKGYGTYDFPQGLYVYDVTSQFLAAGNSMTITPQAGNNNGIYGAYLIVVYQDPTTAVKKIWINDECDILNAGTARSATSDEATAYANFAGVDSNGAASAQAIAILQSAGDSGKSRFFFNSNEYTGFWADRQSGPDIGFSIYDVTSALTSGDNTARLQSYDSGTGGDNMYATNMILVIEKAASAPVAAFSATPIIGLAPLSVTFTDSSTSTPTAWNWEYRASGTSDSWTPFSTAQNPTFSFAAGAYDIRLTATNSGGSATVTKTQFLSVSAGPKRLTTVQSGTVSGDMYVGAFQPVPWGSQSTTSGPRTFTQAYTIPAHTNIQWARLYAEVYAAGTDNREGQAIVSFDANNDGTYETVLGTETLATASTSAADVYPVNDHVNRQYSDYMLWYDVTPLIGSSTSVNAQIYTTNVGGSTFDGRLKTLSLVVAYNDSDTDTVRYWVNDGHDYQPSSTGAPGITSTFGTSGLTAGFTSATLQNIALSSRDAVYNFTTHPIPNTPGTTLPSFETNIWDVKNYLPAGSDSDFVYAPNGGSFKTILATLKVRYVAPPVAAFGGTPTSGMIPLDVQFTDDSTGSPTSWAWDFNNDGTTDSTLQNPSYTYTAPGTYTVKLTVTNEGGSDDEIKTDYITTTANPTISFVPATQSFPVSNTRDYQIVMNSAPSGLSGYDFVVSLDTADIGIITNVAYPTWAGYQNTGTIPAESVRISAADNTNQVTPGATNVILATISVRGVSAGTSPIAISAIYMDADGGSGITPVVTAGEVVVTTVGTPVAAFSGTPASGTIPLNVQFTDASTGTITSWAWDFNNDGTVDSTAQNPTYTYAAAGTYTVKLTVTGPGGSNSLVKPNCITVNPTGPVAAFSGTPTAGNVPLNVQFTDASTGTITSWAWDFNNDGSTDSILQNPSHIYTTLGTYSVKLTVTGPGGSSSKTETDYITVGTNAPVANFVGTPTAGTAPLTVAFTDTSTGSITTWAWDFTNDGTVDSILQNPSFTYAAAGTYTVKLAVTGPGGSNSKTRTNYITASGLTSEFTSDKVTGVASRNVSLPVQFTDQSTGYPNGPTSWSWNFGDAGTSTSPNPTHDYFGRPRSFSVSLTIANAEDHASKTMANYISITPYLEPFPGYALVPTDLNGDWVYEDINGNGRLDYDDVAAYFINKNWADANTRVDIENYDYNFNGRIDYDDIVILYWMVLGSH